MDELETLDHDGWEFLCSGELLPSGAFQAAVRYKTPPDGQIRTLMLDAEPYATVGEALAHVKELAMKWACARSGDSHGES